MDVKNKLGYYSEPAEYEASQKDLLQYVYVKLAAQGYSLDFKKADGRFIKIAESLFKNYQEKNRLLSDHLCPADWRIQQFLDDYLKDTGLPQSPKFPSNTFVLDQHGVARILSLPHDRDVFESEYLSSYRLYQGVLHNPRSDRRTTEGSFHVAEGGLPIPDDKKAVPAVVFGNLLQAALNPPRELLRVPFTAYEKVPLEAFVSLLLRPTVCPAVPGFMSEKTMEIRFFAPGSLVCNLDFVGSIFGNAGDPYLPENDAGLDVEHWTGHSGCILLAPHITKLTKKELGLPSFQTATERQKRDGMCWKDEKELYNNGQAFKLTCRDERGVMVTLIADNYFGYCKKEIKTQISMSANLYGLCEEEHAGGAVAFRRYDLNEKFSLEQVRSREPHTFEELKKMYADYMELQPEGYGIDKTWPDIFYVPEDAVFDLASQTITWSHNGKPERIKLLAVNTYVYPCGYWVYMEKKFGGRYWRLIGTVADGVFCHKPSTVSGGGKSEISKPIANAIIQGPVFVADYEKDFDLVEKILYKDYSGRFKPDSPRAAKDKRAILDASRSMGSLIKLLTPLPDYTDEYNAWLKAMPNHVKELVFTVKRFYKPSWGKKWREHFSVDIINGLPGYELKYHGHPLVANYLRVGLEQDGSWRLYQLRQDYMSAEKLQLEDDITASIVISKQHLQHQHGFSPASSVKIVKNCEYRFFQRPDEAIHRGYDKETEAHFTLPNNFISNYEPLVLKDVEAMIQDASHFDQYSEPMRKMMMDFYQAKKPDYVASTAHPRMVDGKPSKNPRFLQNRPDLVMPRRTYLYQLGYRLYHKIPHSQPVCYPVNAVLSGRRNNPPDPESGMRPLCVYSPVHYQKLPEYFMDVICSLTGKSPSTTGAGSEGALTKAPFNALLPVSDLNNALVAFILTGVEGFSSAAGYVGPKIRVDHDISLLIPEIWCRMTPEERDPEFLIREGYLEALEDFDHRGKVVLASRLGYRITKKFVNMFLGRVFNNPGAVFDDEMLKPEIQSMDIFADGVQNIVEAQQRVALAYFRDGSAELACPPIQALLHIMAYGHWEGKDIRHPEVRKLFTRESLLASEWYQERLKIKQAYDVRLWQKHLQYLEKFLCKPTYAQEAERLGFAVRLQKARASLDEARSNQYVEKLKGTIGSDPVDWSRLKSFEV